MLYGSLDGGSEHTNTPVLGQALVEHDESTTSCSVLAFAETSENSINQVSRKSRLSDLTRLTKAKTKRFLKGRDALRRIDTGHKESIMDHQGQDAEFHPGDRAKEQCQSGGGALGRTLGVLQSAGRTVIHPKDAIKSKVTKTTAGQLSKAERPYLSQKADLEFLQAHDNLKWFESSSPSRHGDSDDGFESVVGKHKHKIREMEEHRESLQVTWTTSRHVRRVRVVPKHHINFPEDSFFVKRNKNGTVIRYDWLKWLGYV